VPYRPGDEVQFRAGYRISGSDGLEVNVPTSVLEPAREPRRVPRHMVSFDGRSTSGITDGDARSGRRALRAGRAFEHPIPHKSMQVKVGFALKLLEV